MIKKIIDKFYDDIDSSNNSSFKNMLFNDGVFHFSYEDSNYQCMENGLSSLRRALNREGFRTKDNFSWLSIWRDKYCL